MKLFRKIVIIAILVSLLFSAGFLFSMVFFPFGLNYGEAPLVDQAIHLVHRQNIYRPDLYTPPYTLANYPPVYPFLLSVMIKPFGLPPFQAGRVISLIAAGISSLILYSFAKDLTHNKLASLFAAALFLLHPYVTYWSGVTRVDLTALAFSLIGLWILFHYWQTWPGILGSIAFLVLSIFTRQTYLLAAPLASLVWLFLKDRRKSMLFGLGLFGACAAIGLWINLVTQGGFYNNIVAGNINPYSVSRTLMAFILFISSEPVIIAILLVSISYWLVSALVHKKGQEINPRTYDARLITLFAYSLGSIAVAFTIGKVGSDVNYLLELIVSFALWAAICFDWTIQKAVLRQGVLLALILLQVFHLDYQNYSVFQSVYKSTYQELPVYQQLYQQVQEAEKAGPVLADKKMDLVVLAGQEIYLQPFEFLALYDAGKWQPGALIDEIRAKKFPLVIVTESTYLTHTTWPEPVESALGQNYQTTSYHGWLLFTPKK